MAGFEPRTSGIGSDRSTNWATTPAQLTLYLTLSLFCLLYLYAISRYAYKFVFRSLLSQFPFEMTGLGFESLLTLGNFFFYKRVPSRASSLFLGTAVVVKWSVCFPSTLFLNGPFPDSIFFSSFQQLTVNMYIIKILLITGFEPQTGKLSHSH